MRRFVIERYRVVGSTNDIASSRPIWTAVLADEQTSGRGRMRRVWHSPPGGLYLSCVLPVEMTLTLYPILGGIVAAEALITRGIDVRIKWPNDLIVQIDPGTGEERKVGGVLVEYITSGTTKRISAVEDPSTHSSTDRIVLGIGINLNFRSEDLPEHLQNKATTVLDLLGRPLDRESLLRDLLNRLSERPDPSSIAERWRKLSITLGRHVRIGAGTPIAGKAVDIGDDGSLIVETASGSVRVISPGELRDVFSEGHGVFIDDTDSE